MYRHFLKYILALQFYVRITTAVTCAGGERLSSSSTCLKLLFQNGGFQSVLEANKACVGNGFHMAKIVTSQDLDWIKNRLQEIVAPLTGSDLNFAFLGGSDLENEGEFYWIDGASLPGVFWHTGEPNDGQDRGGEDCIVVNRFGTLIDVGCCGSFMFSMNTAVICEYDPSDPQKHPDGTIFYEYCIGGTTANMEKSISSTLHLDTEAPTAFGLTLISTSFPIFPVTSAQSEVSSYIGHSTVSDATTTLESDSSTTLIVTHSVTSEQSIVTSYSNHSIGNDATPVIESDPSTTLIMTLSVTSAQSVVSSYIGHSTVNDATHVIESDPSTNLITTLSVTSSQNEVKSYGNHSIRNDATTSLQSDPFSTLIVTLTEASDKGRLSENKVTSYSTHIIDNNTAALKSDPLSSIFIRPTPTSAQSHAVDTSSVYSTVYDTIATYGLSPSPTLVSTPKETSSRRLHSDIEVTSSVRTITAVAAVTTYPMGTRTRLLSPSRCTLKDAGIKSEFEIDLFKVRRNETNSYKRKLTCAHDARTSSRIIGVISCAIAAVLYLLLMIPRRQKRNATIQPITTDGNDHKHVQD